MLTTLILQSRPHPEQGFRACLGILRLVKMYGRERLEAACSRGLEIGAVPTAAFSPSCNTDWTAGRPPQQSHGEALLHEHVAG